MNRMLHTSLWLCLSRLLGLGALRRSTLSEVLILSLITLIFGGIPLISQEQAKEMKFSYSTERLFYELGFLVEVTVRGAIEIPVEEIDRLANNRITTVRLAIADELSTQSNFIFISRSLDGDFLYRQEVPHLSPGWNEITLTTPWEITADAPLFIGFQYRSKGKILSMDGSPDNSLANWVKISSKEDLSDSSWNHQGGGAHNLTLKIEGESLPQYDVRLLKSNIRKFGMTGIATPLKVKVRNQAASSIRSIQVECIAADETVLMSQEVTGLNIPSGQEAWISCNGINYPTEGLYSVITKVAKVNGAEDETPEDNNLAVRNIIARADFFYREPLLEHFSTMLCPNCPMAHKTIELYMEDNPEVIHVVHHTGFGSDSLTIPESEQYLFFYTYQGSGTVYAPGACIDRTNQSSSGAVASAVPVFMPRMDNLGKILEASMSTPSIVGLKLIPTYSPIDRSLSIQVSGQVHPNNLQSLKTKKPRLTLFITEDGIPGYQEGAKEPNHFLHEATLREVLTDTWGDLVHWDDKGFVSDSYALQLPPSWDERKVNLVAFLSDFNPDNSNECTIYNSTQAHLSQYLSVVDASLRESLVPQDLFWIADKYIHYKVPVERCQVFNLDGVRLREESIQEPQQEISLQQIPTGCYIVCSTVGGRTITHKVILR